MTDKQPVTWESLINSPIGDDVDVLNTASNLEKILGSVTQQYDKNELLHKLPVVDATSIDTSHMVRLPLKGGGELHLGAVDEGLIRKPIIGFFGTRFGEKEIFFGDIFHRQENAILNSLKIYSHSHDEIRACGRIEPVKEIDWDKVDSPFADDLQRIWK